MYREDEFVLSHRPYAVDLAALRWHGTRHADHITHRGVIPAVWFRRRQRVTVACIGELWDYQPERTDDARVFLARHGDGRYGGDCQGRWDGSRYWGAQEPEEMARHLAVLRPMLAGYPAVPEGFDGWWRF